MFAVNEYVFYGSGGICRIEDIKTAPLEGMPQDKQYYILHSLHDANSVMFVPVDSDCVFLRSLMTRTEAEELLERIAFVTAIDESNAKLLRERYNSAMRTHEPLEWVRVIKTVYLRANDVKRAGRHLSETERTFSETAKKYLYHELSLVLQIPVGEMEQYITDYIQTNI